MAISHNLSATTPDDPTYEIRPSHWNDAHAQTITIVGNTAGASTVSGTNIVFSAGPNATISVNNGTLVWSGGAGAAGNTGYLSDSANTASLGTIVLSNSNGFAWGLNGQTLTASYTQAAQTNQTEGFYAVGNTTQNSSTSLDARTVSFGGRGDITVGYSNGTIQISGTQTVQTQASGAIAGSGFTSAGNNIGLSGTNNSAGLSLSATVAAQTNQTVGLYALGNTTQNSSTTLDARTLSFNGLGGMTVGYSNGSIQMSAPQTVAQTNQTVGLYGVGNTTQNSSTTLDARTLSFGGRGIVTVGYSNGTVQISATEVPQTNQTLGIYASSNTTGASSSSTYDARSLTIVGSDNISVGWTNGSLAIKGAAGGGVTPVASASNGSFSFTTLAFSNANNVTFGTSAGSIITASVAAPGAAAEANAINLLGANTAGNTTATGSTIGWSGINLTLSGTNNSIVNISAPATSSLVGTSGISISTNGSTISIMQNPLSGYAPYDEAVQVAGQHGQGTWQIQPLQVPLFQHDRVALSVNWTNSSNSTGSATISMWVGMYTQNASTLSLSQSTSTSFGITFSGTGGNNSLQAGPRALTIPWTTTWPSGNYWIGVASRTTSGGTDGSFSQFLASDLNSNFSGIFGAASNATRQRRFGLGYYSASSSQVPGSIAFSQINGTASLGMRQPVVIFGSGTA